jgi:hypothetical protein
LPFEAILKTTQGIFNKLSEDREVKKLEYNPGEVQRFFASLPNDDDRKHLWKSYIEWLQTENRRAVELIERFYGRIVLEEFKDACDQFLAHAKEWELVWKALPGSGTVPSSLDTRPKLNAPQFPVGLEKALQGELAEVRRRAGQ